MLNFKLKSAGFLASVLCLCLAAAYAVLAWTPAPGVPPTCPSGYPGCDPPVNIGPTDQSKAGSFGVGMTGAPPNRLHVVGAIGATDWIGAGCEASCESGGGYSVLYPGGQAVLTAGLKVGSWELISSGNIKADGSAFIMGNIGIGTASPSVGLKLDVEGKVGAMEYCDQNGANCKTIASLGGGSLWTASGNNISNTNTGSVGIGTTAPGQKLDVRGNAYFGGHDAFLYIEDTTGGSTGKFRIGVGQAGDGLFEIRDVTSADTSANTRLAIKSNGNVGIGTASPGAKLEIEQTAGDGLLIGNTTAWGGASHMSITDEHRHLMLNTIPHIPYQTGAGGSFVRMADSVAASNYWDTGTFGDVYQVRRDTSPLLTVNYLGNVGIGDNTPTEGKLVVRGGDVQVYGGDVCTDQGGGVCLSTVSGDRVSKSGTPSAGYVTYWSGTDSITGEAGFTYNAAGNWLSVYNFEADKVVVDNILYVNRSVSTYPYDARILAEDSWVPAGLTLSYRDATGWPYRGLTIDQNGNVLIGVAMGNPPQMDGPASPAGTDRLRVEGGPIHAVDGLIIQTIFNGTQPSRVGSIWMCTDTDGKCNGN